MTVSDEVNTLKEGGAVYDYISGLQVGIANLADSLCGDKEAGLMKKRRLTPREQLWHALLETDYAGARGK